MKNTQKELDAIQFANNVIEKQIEVTEISLPEYDETIHIRKRSE
ncbi:MAG: hypothetical protein QG670_1173 [Thermoproteota archaeon]|nr:hypothetical protein [Thermoproteota archaeon]